MPFELSGGAAERPAHTIQAAGVLHDHAPEIALACKAASREETVVAAVRGDFSFSGVWTVKTTHLRGLVTEVEEEGGWTLLFGSQNSVSEVETRCVEMARLAFARWETMRRWISRHR